MKIIKRFLSENYRKVRRESVKRYVKEEVVIEVRDVRGLSGVLYKCDRR